MSWEQVAGAMGGANGALSGIMSWIGGKSQARAAAYAAGQANNTLWNANQLNQQYQAPWYNTGSAALGTLSQLLGIGAPGGGGVAGGGLSAADTAKMDELNKSIKWYTDVMAGRDPDGPGGWSGGAPTNPGTISKFNAALQSAREELAQLQARQQSAQNAAAGANAVPAGQFGSLMKDFTAQDFTADPGYEFRLAEGQKALDRSAAAKGQLFSGGTIKDATNYNQNFASNEFQNAYNRFNTNKLNRFNMLSSLAGMGQVSANNISNQNAQTANQVANNTVEGLTSAANSRASSYAGIANGLNQGMNTAMNWYMLSQFGQGGGGGGDSTGWAGSSPSVNQIPISANRNPYGLIYG